jgi:hypothetical protein
MAWQTCLEQRVCCSAGQTLCSGQCCSGQCVNGVCCSNTAQICGNVCCQASEQCLAGRCCPLGQVCNEQCCAAGSTCINNQCAPLGSTRCGMTFCLAGRCCLVCWVCMSSTIVACVFHVLLLCFYVAKRICTAVAMLRTPCVQVIGNIQWQCPIVSHPAICC